MSISLKRVRNNHLRRDLLVFCATSQCHLKSPAFSRRNIHVDGRSRLSGIFVPTSGASPDDQVEKDGFNNLLTSAGFLQQAHAGVFHLLPLGLRVQQKIERLIDKHMLKLGASKVSLSSITTINLWEKSGRWNKGVSEFYRLNSNGENTNQLLSPTHEEEITEIAAKTVQSARQLPLRLYQISRKYRDERRPRQGLLRAREFLMKDLYTFDADETTALITYESVKAAYYDFFNELKLPFLVAEADSGNMGGSLSHEFHFPSPLGEDIVMSCSDCNYVANEEKARRASPKPAAEDDPVENLMYWHALTRDKQNLVIAVFPSHSSTSTLNELNAHALKIAVPDIDFSVSNPPIPWLTATNLPLPSAPSTTLLLDPTLNTTQASAVSHHFRSHPALTTPPPLDLLRIHPGDSCPRCPNGTLSTTPAIELGHTFHLGTRYSAPLHATVTLPSAPAPTPLSMGCHGIGVSRLLGAVAALLADARGLNWPAPIAPFEAVVVPAQGRAAEALQVYDALAAEGVDAVLDDRGEVRVGWKLRDAELVGYPVVVVVGRGWGEGRVEVQCRRREGMKEEVRVEDVVGVVAQLLKTL